jgi:hypothetical protein
MKASSESGLCAMEISRVEFNTADSEGLVLTKKKSFQQQKTITGEWGG